MSAAEDAAPVSAAQAEALFRPLVYASTLILAVSGGPDSTALMLLAARWRAARRKGPALLAVTIDHGLRRESAAEARAVEELARRLGIPHRTLRWRGKKPETGIQEAARVARYRLLAQAANAAKARCVLTAHTLDDQAETVLLRMMRGSGLTGLGAMTQVSRLPAWETDEIVLVRPLLDIPKARLIATLDRAKVEFVRDPSNRDPRFTRPRLRDLMPALAREGLDARRLAILARRLRRAEAAIEMAVGVAASAVLQRPWSGQGAIVLDAVKFDRLPAEVALRLLARAIGQVGDEGPAELAKVEVLFDELRGAATSPRGARLRRTLAGALVTRSADSLAIERAPARKGRGKRLTTAEIARRGRSKLR